MSLRITRFLKSPLLRRHRPTGHGTGLRPPRPQRPPQPPLPARVPGIGMGSCGMPPAGEVAR
ncbi:hypothetical protein [Streptomyces monashensis]|uniref:hypothetical protein n=1 Tax=Streptomyces monashensis TaxID=1678012 RepID=UPI0011600BC9|nr:hypothetical protein [Streptomyces monashensis]